MAEVPGEIWKKLVSPANVLMQPAYLQMIEQLHSGRLRFHYAVCSRGEELVGFFYFQESTFEGTNLLPYFPNTDHPDFIRRLSARFISLFKPIVRGLHLPMLNAGNVFMTGESGCYCLEPGNKEQQYRLQMACIDKILEQNPQIRVVLNGDFYEKDEPFINVYREKQFRKIYVEADNAMDVSEFQTFDDYMNKLASKYRVRAKKILKASEAITSRSLTLEEVKEFEPKLVELYKHVTDKVDFKLAELNDDFFYEQKKILPDGYRIDGYFLNDELIGFVSMYLIEQKAEVHYFGINYALLKEYHLYQRMLYDVIKTGIEQQREVIHFGRTAPEVKSTVGAKQFPMFGYLIYRNKLINAFIQLFTRNLKPREYVLRSPFK